MVNKKGFIRVLEATIAVLVILGAILVISSQKDIKFVEDLSERIPPILDELAKDSILRERVVIDYNLAEGPDESDNPEILDEIRVFFGERIKNPAWSYDVRICSLSEECSIRGVGSGGDVFVKERVVSVVLSDSNFSPRKVKVFLWRNA